MTGTEKPGPKIYYARISARWQGANVLRIREESTVSGAYGKEVDIDVRDVFNVDAQSPTRYLEAGLVIPPLPDLPQYTVVVVPDIQYPNQGRVYTKATHAWFRYDKSTASFDTDDGLFRNNPSARVVMPGGRLTRELALQALGLRQETQ